MFGAAGIRAQAPEGGAPRGQAHARAPRAPQGAAREALREAGARLMNEKVAVQFGTRRLVVEMESLTPIEINALAQNVTERMNELQQQNNKVADTSKIVLLVALSFAADLDKEVRAHETTRRMLETAAERLTQSLRASLAAGGAEAS